MSEQLYCTHTRPEGAACRSWARRGRPFCYWHDPETEEERATGLRAVRPKPEAGDPLLPAPARLETAEDIQQLLAAVANHLATAEKPDSARAHSLATVAGVLLRATHIAELERQIRDLNRRVTAAEALNTDLERQVGHARKDLERYRHTLAEMREHLATQRAAAV